MSSCFLTQKFSPEYLRSNQMMSTCRVNQAFPCSFCHGENYFSLYHSEIYCMKQIFCKVIFMNFLLMFICFFFSTQKGKKCMTSFSTVSLAKRNMRATLRTFLMGSCTLNTLQRMDPSEQQVQNKNKRRSIYHFR